MEKIKYLLKKIKQDEVFVLGTQLAYSMLLSFFPFLIFLSMTAGYSSLPKGQILYGLKEILPGDAFSLVKKTLNEITTKRNGSLLTFNLLFAVFASSSGFNAVIRGLNKAYGEGEKRSFIKTQIVAFISMLFFVFIIIAAMLLLVFGDFLGRFLCCRYSLSKFYTAFLSAARYVVITAALMISFAFIYKIAPSRHLKLKEVMPGTLFSTASWIIASIIFEQYINNFSNYSVYYGSLGAIVILILWLNITSVIILLGGEINASLT